jgi:hypothetical protein
MPTIDRFSRSRIKKYNRRVENRIRVFQRRRIGILDWLLVILPMSLGVILLIGFGTINGINILNTHGPAAAVETSRLWFLLGTILLFLLLMYILARALSANKKITLDRYGIRIQRSLLERRDYSWSQLAGIAHGDVETTFLGIRISKKTTVTIFPSAERPITLDNQIQRLHDLIKIIKTKVFPAVWPQLCSDFDSGKWVRHGQIRINFQNLIVEDRCFRWQQVRGLRIDAGYLVIDSHDRPELSYPVTEIPNLELLLHLVERGMNQQIVQPDTLADTTQIST